jgi:hypothetical protein
MEYVVQMDSAVTTYIPSFIKIGSSIQKLIKKDTHAHRQHGYSISRLSFFQNKEMGYKLNYYY